MKDVSVFDLGELDAPHHGPTNGSAYGRAVPPTRSRTAYEEFPASFATAYPAPRGAGILPSLSIFVPGAGQLLLGRIAMGLCVLSSIGFLGTLGWAILASIDRLARTLDLFGIPATTILVTLLAIYILTAILHLCGVLHAHALVPRTYRPGWMPPKRAA